MTILYKVKNDLMSNVINSKKPAICKVSKKNIVAFCVQLDEVGNFESNNKVYVCDILTPWKYFAVCPAPNVNVIEWSTTGELLLIGYKGGQIEIWATKQQELNSWQMLYHARMETETIIDAKFFHDGRCISFHSAKKDKDYLSYGEKFDRIKYQPTLTKFGGAPVEGCMIVTASGLLGFITIPKLLPPHPSTNNNNNNDTTNPNSIIQQELKVSIQCLPSVRCYIQTCSISYCLSGCLKLALCTGLQTDCIQYYKVYARMENEHIIINCKTLPSILLKTNGYTKITNLKWATHIKDDVIFAASEGKDGSTLLGKFILTKPQKNEKMFYESWENTANLRLSAGINDICLSKMTSDIFYLVLVLNNSTVQLLDSNLKKPGINLFERLTEDNKQNGFHLLTADITHMDQILIALDNYRQVYAMQVANTPHFEKIYKTNTVSMQVSLLEYCILTGIDASDILLLNLNNLDVLIEKITENYMRQSAVTRQFYYSNFLSLKSNMHRIQSKQHDFDNLIMLHSISITFKSLLRPADLGSQDKAPAENLSMILSEPLPDVDKVLFNLNSKDFTVEPATLQSLQQLMQWVSDLALNILHKMPEEMLKTKHNKKQGYDISRDMVAIASIRELLVMIRIWGLLNAQCLPIYTKSDDSLDVLSTLFRLLTRLTQHAAEPDEILLDQCNDLSTQILVPQNHYSNPTTLLSCQNINYKMLPFIFTIYTEPSYAFQDVKMEEIILKTGIKDNISNLHLGCRVATVRKCIRCGFVNSSLVRAAKSSALKAWCNRWVYCHCGGFWITAN